MRIGLVCTSIGDGEFLEGYCKQVEKEGFKYITTFYIIPDDKTPNELYNKCHVAIMHGYDVMCPLISDQMEFLRSIDLEEIVPFNSDNRRNVGYLMALKDGCDKIISIDDDNFCREDSGFFNLHALVGEYDEQRTVVGGWYNICWHLSLSEIYPRGFPYKQRGNASVLCDGVSRGIVAVNEGLWNKDPDLDALTWMSLTNKPKAAYDGDSFFLGDKTWSPLNSQNTAVSRDAMVANYFIPMGAIINGMKIDHHADIFTGYFLQACVKKMGHKIRIGTPIVDHIRNNHDYMEDLAKEYICIQMLEDLTEWLHEEQLDGTTYSECYLSLASRMEDACEKFKGKIWTVDAKAFIHRTAYCMRKWVKAYELL